MPRIQRACKQKYALNIEIEDEIENHLKTDWNVIWCRDCQRMRFFETIEDKKCCLEWRTSLQNSSTTSLEVILFEDKFGSDCEMLLWNWPKVFVTDSLELSSWCTSESLENSIENRLKRYKPPKPSKHWLIVGLEKRTKTPFWSCCESLTSRSHSLITVVACKISLNKSGIHKIYTLFHTFAYVVRIKISVVYA